MLDNDDDLDERAWADWQLHGAVKQILGMVHRRAGRDRALGRLRWPCAGLLAAPLDRANGTGRRVMCASSAAPLWTPARAHALTCTCACRMRPVGAFFVSSRSVTARGRGAAGGASRGTVVRHDAETFTRRECHHDIQMGVVRLICVNAVAIRATVRGGYPGTDLFWRPLELEPPIPRRRSAQVDAHTYQDHALTLKSTRVLPSDRHAPICV